MLSVFVVLVVFFGLTVFLLDMLFRRAAESSLREVLDAQMVALVAAADPDGPESVTPTAVLETRFDTPGSGLYAEIRSASGESIWRSQSTIGTDVQFGPPLEGGERNSSTPRSPARRSGSRSRAAASSGTTCMASRRASLSVLRPASKPTTSRCRASGSS